MNDAKAGNGFDRLFTPRSIAVVGASAQNVSQGNRYIRVLKEFGFQGAIYPIHRNAGEIEGLKAYPSVSSVPEPVDYLYATVPAPHVAGILKEARGRLAFAQIMASPDADVTADWPEELLAAAAASGIRLLGPNCMGTHSPRGRMTFVDGALPAQGDVGIASQSGGLGMDILRRGQSVGLQFSGLVTLGNSIDLGPCDLLEFYLEDAATRVVGLYIEDVKDGRRFFDILRQNRGRKPVVVLVGGTTQQGRKAALSHTGALGGGGTAWSALSRQTGVILSQTLDEFLDDLQLCRFLPAQPTGEEPTIILFGNGGGASVLATDAAVRAGFSLALVPPAAEAELATLKIPPGSSLANPIDMPAGVLQEEGGRMAGKVLAIVCRHARPKVVVAHLNLSVIYGYRHVADFLPNLFASLTSGLSKAGGGGHFVLVGRSDGRPEVEDWKRELRAAANANRIPFFDELPQAVNALRKFSTFEQFLHRRAGRPH